MRMIDFVAPFKIIVAIVVVGIFHLPVWTH